MDFFLEHLRPGSVVTAVVTHLESFGTFLDIGCGIVAMLPSSTSPSPAFPIRRSGSGPGRRFWQPSGP